MQTIERTSTNYQYTTQAVLAFVRFVIGTILRMLFLKKVIYLQKSMGTVSSNSWKLIED